MDLVDDAGSSCDDVLLSPRSLKRKLAVSQGGSSPKRRALESGLSPGEIVTICTVLFLTYVLTDAALFVSKPQAGVTGYATTDDERRLMYQSVMTVFAGTKRKSRTTDTVPIGSALDDLINAPTRDIPCR